NFTSPAQRKVTVVQGGEVVHQFDASRLSHAGRFASDKPGSLYGLSDRGLVHYTAKQPQGHPHGYTLNTFYHLNKGIRLTNLFASTLGFLVIESDEQGKRTLHVIDLSNEEEENEELIDELRSESHKLIEAFAGWSLREPLTNLLKDYPPELQVQVLVPLVDVTSKANPDIYGNQVVIEWLGKRWKEALPHVVKMLEDESASRRSAAAQIVRDMWFKNQGMEEMPWVQSTGPKLAKLLTDDDSQFVRIEAARALASFDEAAAPYVEQLHKALQDDDAKLQNMALAALSEVGPDAWLALPILTRIVKEPGELSRNSAAEAIQYMGPAAVQAVPTLLEVAAAPGDFDDKSSAGDALWWIADRGRCDVDPKVLAKAIVNGESGGPAYLAQVFGIKDLGVIIALAESLDVTHEYDSYEAFFSARALVTLGTDNELVLGYLRDLAESNRAYASLMAAGVYARLTGDNELALAVLEPALKKGERDDAYHTALRAVELIGPGVSDLLPAINVNRGKDNPYTPIKQIQTRWVLGGKPDSHLAWIASEVHHRSTNDYGEDAAEALRLLGPMADAETPKVAEVLGIFVKYSGYNRFYACTALRSIGPTVNTRAAVSKLLPLLEKQTDPSPYNRRVAAEAVWSITRDADLVANALAETLDDRGRNFFWSVHRLEQMGPHAAAAIPRLEEALEDQNPHFRRAAEQALKSIKAEAGGGPFDQNDFDAWYDELGHEDDFIAVAALWRFVEAGDPAHNDLRQRISNILPDALEGELEPDRRFPYKTLEENRRFRRALQAIEVIEMPKQNSDEPD
ncbi:MAG: HEAT repeat domain-containing protein, partial [Planctomycetota bacterium]